MKKIKLKICDLDLNDKFSFGFGFLELLKKHYEVELSENPEYIIYHGSTYEYLKSDCVRILFVGENITPNFNLCDYAMGFDYLNFNDRYYRLPVYLTAQFYTETELKLAAALTSGVGLNREGEKDQPDFTRQKLFTKEDLAKKTAFCSFVYSNYLADRQREEMFNKLSEYKKVDAGGAYLNNVGGKIKNKLAFELEHKFSVAFENSSRSGYTTEKLTNSLVARTIPIYWGNPEIHKEFNSNRFINCHAYKNFNEVVAKVKEIDQNDEQYLRIINEPVVAPGMDFQATLAGFERFFCNIFDQPFKQAKRATINAAHLTEMEAGQAQLARKFARKFFLKKLLSLLYRPFKKIAVFERLKQKILARRIHKNN